ncbi:hypothetical protein MMC06_006822 [Schaereria dolodes]|nr:hypothetical protein [Schaereria dolodes]
MLEQPPLIPISESDNPDAIALRSAISILQMQRLQSIRNLRLLEKQKAVAVANPETFAKDLASGKIQSASRTGILASGPTSSRQPEYSNEDDSAEPDRNETKFQGNPVDIPIPGPQNIVRCPPINWAKYHVVGEALDKLHNEQRSRPIAGEPQIDRRQQQASEHLIAAPYRPWTDQLLDAPVKTRDPPRKKL